MNDSILYLILITGITLLIVSLEWNKIRRIKVDMKRILIVLIILFFLGTALLPLAKPYF